MRLIAHSFPNLKVLSGLQVKSQHTGAWLAGNSKEVLDRFELNDGRLLGITTKNASSNYLITRELQTTLEATGSKWPAFRNHIPCMAHIILLALGAFMSSPGVQGRTKSWEAHERDQQFGENESTYIGKSQRLRKEGNARIKKVSAMRPGLAKIIEKVRISTYFESAEADLHTAENACCINYADTRTSKRVHWLSQSQTPDRSTTHYGCEDTLELDTGVAQARQPIVWLHLGVDWNPKIQWLPAALHDSGWADYCEVCHGGFIAIPVLDPLDVEMAYCYYSTRHNWLYWHVSSHGRRDASFGQEKDTIEGRLILCGKVCPEKAFQIIYRSDSNDWYAPYFCAHPWSVPEVEII